LLLARKKVIKDVVRAVRPVVKPVAHRLRFRNAGYVRR
jgi:hypothetical protein